MKALHSMWKHKAKGNSVYSSDRQVKDCVFKYRLVSDSWKIQLCDCAAHIRQNLHRPTICPVLTWAGCSQVQSLQFITIKIILIILRTEFGVELQWTCNVLKCLCRCSSLFSCSDHTSTFLWHTGRKGKPIIISAENNGFENYLLRGTLQKSSKI